jgi:hypothetical protein
VSRTRRITTSYLQPAFLLCAATLALAGAGMWMARRQLGLALEKHPLPLRKPLGAMDRAKLLPYEVVAELTIGNEEVLDALGTEDYIQWVIEDPRTPADSTVGRVMVFITYYKLPDRVPHVPEECYTGGGYQRERTQPLDFELEGGDGRRSIPGRYLLFRADGPALAAGPERLPVVYLFRVNGEYAGSREQARLVLNRNIFGRFSYFCKVELVYNQSLTTPELGEALDASEELLTKLLPVLEQDHWPPWPPDKMREEQSAAMWGPGDRSRVARE